MSEQPILSEAAQLDAEMLRPLPRSQKVHVNGKGGIRVGMREIALSPTRVGSAGDTGSRQLTPNPHLRVYDTSGPYTDPQIAVDVRAGIPRLRDAWILARGDTEPLPGFSSSYTLSRNADEALQKLRFAHLRTPRRALPGRNVTQMHYARAGVVTPEMEYIAIRENLARANPDYNPDQHPGENFGASTPREITPEFGARGSGRGTRHHPEQHQPPGIRAHDHRPQLPGESERQHRQLGGDFQHRGRGREDGLGHALGHGYRDGTSPRARTSTRPASGSCATHRFRSARYPSIRRSRRSAA